MNTRQKKPTVLLWVGPWYETDSTGSWMRGPTNPSLWKKKTIAVKTKTEENSLIPQIHANKNHSTLSYIHI